MCIPTLAPSCSRTRWDLGGLCTVCCAIYMYMYMYMCTCTCTCVHVYTCMLGEGQSEKVTMNRVHVYHVHVRSTLNGQEYTYMCVHCVRVLSSSPSPLGSRSTWSSFRHACNGCRLCSMVCSSSSPERSSRSHPACSRASALRYTRVYCTGVGAKAVRTY